MIKSSMLHACHFFAPLPISLGGFGVPEQSNCLRNQEETSKWVIDLVPLPEPNRTARVGRANNAKDVQGPRHGY